MRQSAGIGVCSLCLLVASSAGRCGQRPPNIIFILADDLGWHELGCYGNRFNETPNLDRLARQGIRFTQAYAAAPVCSPYRAALMTGQWPARIGINDYLRPGDAKHLPAELVTLPERLQSAGYVTGIIGKWHLTGYAHHGAHESPPGQHGFDEVLMSENRGIGGGSYFFPYHFNREIRKRLPGEREFLVDRMNLEAVEFIQRHSRQPFFLYLSHYAVHTRLNGKPELVAKYEGKPGAGHGPQARRDNPHLAAQLESIDEGIGQIVAKLEALNLLDDTLIVFSSDNGGEARVTDNGTLRGGKSMLYEGGIRVPLILAWRGQLAAGRVCDTITANIDFYPTLLAIAHTSPPYGQVVDGISLLPVLHDADAHLPVRALYWHYPLAKPHFLGGRSRGAIRGGDWKLIEDYTTGDVELYNLRNDIGEQTDLVQREPQRAAALRKQLQAWRASLGAAATKMSSPPARQSKWPKLAVVWDERTLSFDNHGVRVDGGRWFFSGETYLDLPRGQAPAVAGREVSIRALVRATKPDGVILAHGGDRTGFALYLTKGRPAFSTCVGWKRTTIVAPATIGDGTVEVEASWLDGGEMRISVDGVSVAAGRSPGLLPAEPGDSLQIGADTIKPTGVYDVPNRFTGVMEGVTLTLRRPAPSTARVRRD